MDNQNLLYDLAKEDRLQEDESLESDQQFTGNTTLSDISQIQSLPVELLSMIFLECLHCTGSNEHTTTPITLRQVCRLWESVICDLPYAWKSLKLHQYSFVDLESVINDYFCFRGQHRLDVNISMYNNVELSYPSKRMEPLSIIRNNFRYFETITGRISPAVLHELFGREYDYDMATIRALDLEISSFTSGIKPPFLSSPSFHLENIEVLKLHNLGYLLPSIKSCLPRLSLLSLCGDDSNYLLDHSMILSILSVACNLQEFFWTPSQKSGERLLVTTVKLPKLTKLHINLQRFSADIVPVMNVLEMPHLTNCHIDRYNDSMMDVQRPMDPTLIYFISTRGNRIQELALNNFPIDSKVWERSSPYMCNLRSLQIEGELGDGFFQYLTDSSSCPKLPKLECLTVSKRVFSDKELEALLGFAKTRKGAKTNCAQLRILHIECTVWNSPSYTEFQSLASENLDLDWQVNLLNSTPSKAG